MKLFANRLAGLLIGVRAHDLLACFRTSSSPSLSAKFSIASRSYFDAFFTDFLLVFRALLRASSRDMRLLPLCSSRHIVPKSQIRRSAFSRLVNSRCFLARFLVFATAYSPFLILCPLKSFHDGWDRVEAVFAHLERNLRELFQMVHQRKEAHRHAPSLSIFPTSSRLATCSFCGGTADYWFRYSQ